MPTVARYGPRKVDTAALPGARLTAAETAESEGLAVARADAQRGEALGEIGQPLARLGAGAYAEEAKAERDRADEVAVLNANNQRDRWENERVWGPNGAMSSQGKDAFGLPEQIGDEYSTTVGNIAGTLSTQRQRDLFAKSSLERGVQLDLQIRRHVYGEMQKYEADELTGAVANSQQRAWHQATDIRAVGQELTYQTNMITQHGARLGMGPQAVQDAVDQARSKTHVGVLENLIAQDQLPTAQVYFDEAKSQISGDQIDRLEHALTEGKVRKDAQAQADAIQAAGGTLAEQRAKAKQITDPKTRDQTLEYLEHEAAVQERADRDTHEAALTSAYTILDQTPDVTKIPSSAWVSFTGADRSSLRAYADRLVRGEGVETDIPTYYKLMQQAGTDPTGYAGLNLLAYKGKLGDTEFKQLAGLQLSIRNNDREAAMRTLGPAQLQESVVDDSLTLYGIDPKAKYDTPEGKAIAELRQMLRNRVEFLESSTGKKATTSDVQQLTDQILSTQVTVPGSWWNIWPASGPFFTKQRRLTDLTIADVPAADRTQIESALKRRNRPVSDATVLDAYIELKARGK